MAGPDTLAEFNWKRDPLGTSKKDVFTACEMDKPAAANSRASIYGSTLL